MKHLKQKLMAATAMLMVSAVMMTTSTYAWFAISTAPEVTEIVTSITASGSFEIALGTDGTEAADAPEDTSTEDTGDDTTWGATVTSVSATSGLNFPMVYDSSDEEFQAPTYDDSGRTEALAEITTTTGTYDDGMADVTADITTGTNEDGDAATTEYTVASSTLLWLRTNMDVEDAVATITGVAVDEDAEISLTDIGVALVIGGDIYNIEIDSSGEGTVSGLSFTANTATAVEVYVYLIGTGITNADLGTDATITIGSIEFTSVTITPTE